MAWTTPRTWVTNELVTAAMMNEQLRDNLDYLLTPAAWALQATGAYATTSASYSNVDAALTQVIECHGGRVVCGFSAWLVAVTGNPDVAVGVDGGSEILVYRSAAHAGIHISGTVLFGQPSNGNHTFSLRYRINTGTLTLRGADNGGVPIPPIIFWGIEI